MQSEGVISQRQAEGRWMYGFSWPHLGGGDQRARDTQKLADPKWVKARNYKSPPLLSKKLRNQLTN